MGLPDAIKNILKIVNEVISVSNISLDFLNLIIEIEKKCNKILTFVFINLSQHSVNWNFGISPYMCLLAVQHNITEQAGSSGDEYKYYSEGVCILISAGTPSVLRSCVVPSSSPSNALEILSPLRHHRFLSHPFQLIVFHLTVFILSLFPDKGKRVLSSQTCPERLWDSLILIMNRNRSSLYSLS